MKEFSLTLFFFLKNSSQYSCRLYLKISGKILCSYSLNILVIVLPPLQECLVRLETKSLFVATFLMVTHKFQA